MKMPLNTEIELGKKPLILIAEKDDSIIKSLHVSLKSKLYADFTVAMTGETALTRAIARKPNIITMNVQFRDMTCLELMKALKRDPTTANIPLFLLSDSDLTSYIAQKSQLGFISINNIMERYKYLPIMKKILE